MNPICGMKRRNDYHECSTPIKTFHVIRGVDNMEGTLTICESEMERLKSFGFKVLEEVVS